MFEIFNKMLGWNERPLLPPSMPSAFFSKLQTVRHLVCNFEKNNYLVSHDLQFPLILNIFNDIFIHPSVLWMYDDLYNH